MPGLAGRPVVTLQMRTQLRMPAHTSFTSTSSKLRAPTSPQFRDAVRDEIVGAGQLSGPQRPDPSQKKNNEWKNKKRKYRKRKNMYKGQAEDTNK